MKKVNEDAIKLDVLRLLHQSDFDNSPDSQTILFYLTTFQNFQSPSHLLSLTALICRVFRDSSFPRQ